MKNKYLRLFESCQIVIGANRSTICDLQKGDYMLIPNGLAKLFEEKNAINFIKCSKDLKENDVEIFDDYIHFLIVNEFAFWCSEEELKCFPNISLNFDYPAFFSNAIIDFNINSKHDFSMILSKILIPGLCRSIQFRFFDKISLTYIQVLMNIVSDSFIKSVEIIMKSNLEIDNLDLKELVNKHKKIRCLTLHSSEKNLKIQSESNGRGTIVSVKERIDSSTHCGIIHQNYFNPNIESFVESKSFNSCLNKKISVDVNGLIKNCPSMKKSFGKIEDFSIETSLTPEFKKYWNITKDQINICKDCEFRHICTDCRAYIENPEDDYSKPLKCGYDPYTNKWEEWSTNTLKQKTIEYYGMQDLVKKDD